MKAIIKPNRIEEYEALVVNEPILLTHEDNITQEIVFEDGQLILREHSIDKNERYNSTVNIDVFIKKGDLLIKTPNGYMKPLVEFIPLTKELEKAIKIINR
jgi:hypothetical protein